MTQDYAPDIGGMARRHVELCRRLGDAADSVTVSTVAASGQKSFDAGETYSIHRQPFPFSRANRFLNQMRWSAAISRDPALSCDIIHCGNIRPTGYAVWLASHSRGIPYLVYTNGGDLLRERAKAARMIKRASARKMFEDAAGIIATSAWVEKLTRDVLAEIGVSRCPPVRAIDLGTDPGFFSPGADRQLLRGQWGIGESPMLLTVARLVPHKGQDVVIRVLAATADTNPELRYVIVGEGHDEQRLRILASELGVSDRVIFAGALSDEELREAYATSDIYVGLSRVDREINAEGFGISFLEAAASGVPVVAGDSGGVRSAVRDGDTGFVVPPTDVDNAATVICGLLANPGRRSAMGARARTAVETHYNWDRVASETRAFARQVVSAGRVA